MKVGIRSHKIISLYKYLYIFIRVWYNNYVNKKYNGGIW